MITLNPALTARDRQARRLDRGGQGRGPRRLQRPSVRARRALRDDAGGRDGLLRPREGPGGPGRPEDLATAGEVRGEGARFSLARRLVAAGLLRRGRRCPWFVVKDARVVTVSGPVIEKGTVLISGGKIAAVGRERRGPGRRDRDRRRGQDGLSGPHRRPHLPSASIEIQQRARVGGHGRGGRRQPAGARLGGLERRTAS